MIIHHTLDYFILRPFLLRHYVRFITGSFIFISGFIISSIYFNKYNDSNIIKFRLTKRGIKLLILFAFINFAKSFLEKRSFTHNVIIEQFYTVFISGSYEIVAFELLVPIAYVLLFTGFIIFLFKNKIQVIIPISLIFFFYSSIIFYYMNGGYNFRYFTIGMLGATFGFIPLRKICLLHKYWLIVFIVYFLYLIYLTFSRLYFPYYFVCVLFNLTFLYVLGSKLSYKNVLSSKLLLLGNYTLLSYLAQITILQILVRILPSFSSEFNTVLTAFIITFIGTYLCIEIVDYYNKHSLIFKKVYRFIFM